MWEMCAGKCHSELSSETYHGRLSCSVQHSACKPGFPCGTRVGGETWKSGHQLGPDLRKEAAPEQERTLAFLLLCDTKAHPVPNWFTPLRGLFLSSCCQFYPCLNFVVDKQMLLNLGLLSSSLENSSQHLTKGWTVIFQTVFFKALIKTNFGHLQKIASCWWVLLIPTLLTSMTSDKDKNS